MQSLSNLWAHLNLAQAIALAVFLLSLVAVIIWGHIPWASVNWQTVAGIIGILASVGGSAASGKMLHDNPVRGPSAPP